MSIECAFFGVLGRDAEFKTSKAGKQYLRLAVRVGDGEAAQWVSVLAFESNAIEQADKFSKGARVYVEGSIRLEEWSGQDGTARHGLSVMSWHARLAAIGRNKAACPSAKVLLVEGEKTANALGFGPLADAFKWCAEDVVVVTWPGGGSAEKYADFSPLKGRDVIILPDDHQPGEETGDELVKILQAVGVRRLCRWKAPPEAKQVKAEGWDIADDIPPEWGPEALVASILGAPEVLPPSNGSGDSVDEFATFWYGDVDLDTSRPWLLYGTIPEVGVGLLSGQWGAYKTFVAIDLACAVMSGTMIFGSDVDRCGGTLLYAAEGGNEVPVRTHGAVGNRCPQFKKRARSSG
jgi:single-stranded DNA-binding protein